MIVQLQEVIQIQLQRVEAEKLQTFLDPNKEYIHMRDTPILQNLLDRLNDILGD